MFQGDALGDEARDGAEKIVASKELDAMKTELSRLDDQVALNTSNVGEWFTRLPVLNALYSGNVKIDQNWLPDLTINYNFKEVPRFDRCTTCHQGIDRVGYDKDAKGKEMPLVYHAHPHLTDGTARGYAHACSCRKPGRGLLDLALSEHPIDLAASAFIGDSPRDLFPDVPDAGPRILLRSGHPLTDTSGADHVADTLADAVAWLIRQRQSR